MSHPTELDVDRRIRKNRASFSKESGYADHLIQLAGRYNMRDPPLPLLCTCLKSDDGINHESFLELERLMDDAYGLDGARLASSYNLVAVGRFKLLG